MSSEPTPGPWEASWEAPRWVIQGDAPLGKRAVAVTAGDAANEGNARLLASAPFLLAELRAAVAHLLNAKIDLETGCPKATAIRTIEGGLRRAEAAIAKATGDPA